MSNERWRVRFTITPEPARFQTNSDGELVRVVFPMTVRELDGPVEAAKRHARRLITRNLGACRARCTSATRDHKAERYARRWRVEV